jgi:methionine-rich copper-binding protein CopC
MRRQRHIRLLSVLVVAALLLAVTGGGQALAQGTPPAPVLPQSFWGSVKDASGNPILSGTVEAWMNGVKQDSIGIGNGQYGGAGGFDERLIVQGTSEDVGKTIEFYVNGVKANETAKYTPGEKTNLNLTVSGAPQPPADTTPPTVANTDPADNATSVPVDKTISVTFSEEVQQGAGFNQIALKDAKNDTVGCSVSVSGNTLTIDPNADLAYATRYTVTIPAVAVKDLAGNALAQDYTFSFTTQAAPDTTPPVVANTDPANNAIGVPVNKSVSVTFSEDVQDGPAYGSISVKDAAGKVVPVTKSIAGKVLGIKPNADLAYGTKYTVTIPAGAVKDLAGNALSSGFTLSFTTQAASGGGGSSGGGGGGAATPSADKVEKPVKAGDTTVAEISDKVRIEVPAGAVSGANAVIKAEVVGDEKASGAGMPLLSKVVDVTIKNGTLTGKISISLFFDKGKLGENQEPAAFYYDEKAGKWVRLEGTVDLEKGTVTVTVDHFTMFAVFAAAKEVPKPEVVTFKDMQGHWAAEAVGKLAGMGIVSGCPDGTFKPENAITRAEVTAMVVRALKLAPGSENDLKFKDNASIPAWARGVVAAAAREGLVKGSPQPDGTVTFEPARSVSRAEMAALAVRMLEKKVGAVAPAELRFSDANRIPQWARASVGAAVAKGIVVGYPDNTFRPDKPVTRAEAAAMILRLLEAVESK